MDEQLAELDRLRAEAKKAQRLEGKLKEADDLIGAKATALETERRAKQIL